MIGDILVAQGDAGNLNSVVNYGDSFKEGDYGYLDLHLAVVSSNLLDSVASGLNSYLLNKFDGYRLDVYPSLLRIHFKVAYFPLAIIATAVAVVILLIGIILAWKLYKMSPVGVVTSIATLVLVFALAGVAVIAAVTAVRKYLT